MIGCEYVFPFRTNSFELIQQRKTRSVNRSEVINFSKYLSLGRKIKETILKGEMRIGESSHQRHNLIAHCIVLCLPTDNSHHIIIIIITYLYLVGGKVREQSKTTGYLNTPRDFHEFGTGSGC